MELPNNRATRRWLIVAARRRGVATVEFAVVAPLLLVLFVGLLDAGQCVSVAHAVSDASRAAARTAVRKSATNVSEVNAAVTNYLSNCFPNVPASKLTAATKVEVLDRDGTPLTSSLSQVDSGDSIFVEVDFEFKAVRWLPLASDWNTQVLQSTTVMRRE